MTITKDTLRDLAKFDTPTICNIIELFDVRPCNEGYMDGRIRCNFPELPPMVGFAVTTTFRSESPSTGGDFYQIFQDQLTLFSDLPGPAIPVFQDLDDPSAAATFGEVMCSTYKAWGSAGLITSGAGRDLDQVRAIQYPVFSGSTICAHGYCHLLDLGVPVHVGGLMIYQGDLLHGDVNGVTNIPLDIASEVAGIGDEFVASENVIMDYVKGDSEKTVAEYTKCREEFQTIVAKLRKRVSRSL